MSASTFQFRFCLNPECGLRYPLTEHNQFGERCPLCLGETIAVAESTLAREEEAEESEETGSLGPAVLIDNVRSAWNVGSMFRSAEGFGIRHLYLCGITATPENEQVRKTALGAQDGVPWSAHRNAVKLVNQLKGEGCVVWALERMEGSTALEAALTDQPPLERLVLVVGHEQAGVDPGILELADRVVHLEMQGRKRSFNVAVAFAVAAHAIKSNHGLTQINVGISPVISSKRRRGRRRLR